MDPETQNKPLDWSRLLLFALTSTFGAVFFVALVIPNWGPHRTFNPQTACISNLREIDNAKEEWALQTKPPASATPTWEIIKPYLSFNRAGVIPKCPSGGVYTIGAMSNAPTCSIKGHALQ